MDDTKIFLSLNVTKDNFTSDNNKFTFQVYSGVLFAINAIPNLFSIIVIIFQKGKTKLQKYIQLMLCLSFLGIEIKYFPLKIDFDYYYYFQNGISYSCIIITTYYQLIYSVISYKLFICPDDLSKKCNIFFIYIFPIFLFVFFVMCANFNLHIILYYDFLAYPKDYFNHDIRHELPKKVMDVCRLIFFFVNIIYSKKLLNEIKKVIIMVDKIDLKFAKKKYKIYKSKLILYLITMIIVLHPYIIRMIKDIKEEKDAISDYTFSCYFHGIESLSGLIYWFIYIYNKFLIKRFLILFHCKKEGEYSNEFIEEKKIYEESQDKFSSEFSSANNLPLVRESVTSENKTDTSNEIQSESITNSHIFKSNHLELNNINKISCSSYTSYDETL